MHRAWLPALLLLSTLILHGAAQSSLHAAEPAGDESSAAEENKGDIFKPALELGIWTIVVFVVLLLLLGRFAWKPMLEGLHRREQNIQGAIEEARRAREEAQRLRDQWNQEMAQAHEKVREIHEEARRRAEENAQEIEKRARTEIQAERERLRKEIETARDQALRELWNRTAQLATIVSAKAIRRQLSADDHRRLVDEALAELGQAGADRQQQLAGVRG